MGVQKAVLQMSLGGVFTDVPMFATPVTITRGNSPYGSWPRAAKITCEIDNDTLDYDPTRPTSLLYGVAGRNTIIRVRDTAATRQWAEASEWSPDRTIDHVPGEKLGRSSVSLTAEGLLRRLGKWTDPLRSPMYRTLSLRTISIGHWSLEEGAGALALGNSLDGGSTGILAGGCTLGEDAAPLGAASSLKLGSGGALAGEFVPASTTAGWQIGFAFKLAALPASGTHETLLTFTTSNGYTWLLGVDDNSFRLTVLDPTASVLMDDITLNTGQSMTEWILIRVRATVSAGTVTARYAWYQQSQPSAAEGSATFSGSVGALSTWRVAQNAWNLDGWYSHIHAVTGVSEDLVANANTRAVFNGFNGELADRRYYRIVQLELGLIAFVRDFVDYTGLPMGPQPIGTLLDVLREIRDTDACHINDFRLDIALTMTTRRHLYNLTPALELTYPGDIAPPFGAVLSDEGVANIVTVKNRRGGEVTRSLTTGPLSTQPPPDGVGEYRQTIDVNVSDETLLPDIASWHLNRGTLAEAQYGSITVDLVACPWLETAAKAVLEGHLITVAGAEPDLLRFMVVGIVERKTSGTFTITFEVEPYDIYRVAVYDTTRYSSRTSTLNAAYGKYDASIVITFTERSDAWSTTPGYALLVGGERMTVTSMGAVTGSGPWTQTAAVTRSANGVVKTQKAGTPVRIHPDQHGRYAL